MPHKISIGALRKLQELVEGKTIPAGTHAAFFENLVSNGVLQKKMQKSIKRFSCTDVSNLHHYLKLHYGILDLDLEIEQKGKKTSRSERLQSNSNEKSGSIKPFQGFLVHALQDMQVKIAGQTTTLQHPLGASLLIHDWQQFEIPKACQVVIVENFENFKSLEQQKALFPTGQQLFVFRLYDKHQSLINWLQAIPNAVLYFGDWDFGGIKIFVSEFYNKLPNRCQFLIPDQLPQLLENGNRERYLEQLQVVKKAYYQQIPQMVYLGNLLHEYKKVLPQEMVIAL